MHFYPQILKHGYGPASVEQLKFNQVSQKNQVSQVISTFLPA